MPISSDMVLGVRDLLTNVECELVEGMHALLLVTWTLVEVKFLANPFSMDVIEQWNLV